MASALAPSIVRDIGESQEMVNSDTEDESLVSPKKAEESSEDGEDGTDSEVAKNDGKRELSSADESEKTASEPEEEEKSTEKEVKPAAAAVAVVEAKSSSSKSKAPAEKKKRERAPPKPKATAAAALVTASPVQNADGFLGPLDSSAAEQVKSDSHKRDRKQVERFSIATNERTEEKPAFTIVAGSGTKLGDIPFIADQIHKRRAVDLGNAHRLFFTRKGTAHETKKNLRQFSGFPFEKDSTEYTKRRANMMKWESSILKDICEVLGALKKGTKEEIVDRLLAFCLQPTDSGQQPKAKGKKSRSSQSPSKRSKKSPKKSSSRKSSPTKSKKSEPKGSDDESDVEFKGKSDDDEDDEKPKPKKAKVSKVTKVKVTKAKSPSKPKPLPATGSRSGPSRQASTGKQYKETEDENEFDDIVVAKAQKEKLSRPGPVKRKRDESAERAEPESDSPGEVDSEEERKKKKKSSSKSHKKSSSKPSTSNGKKEPSKKKLTTPPPKKQKVEEKEDKDEDSDDEDEPLPMKVAKKPVKADSDSDGDSDEKPASKLQKQLPSDDEIKKTVTKIVDKADLRRVSMKNILEETYAEYPGVNLESKKSFIRTFVKNLMEDK